MSRLLWSLCAAALLLSAPLLQAEEAIQLRYQFSPTDKLLYQTKATVTQKQTVAGMEIDFSQQTTDVSELSLVETDKDGNFKLQSENKRLKAKMNLTQLGEYSFDSTSKENEKGSQLGSSLTPMFESLSGAYLFVTLTPRGGVTQLSGFHDAIKNALKDNPLAAQFAAGGTDEAAKLNYQLLLPTFPEKAVAPGDTWEEPLNLKLPQLGEMTGKRTYKFEGLETVGDRKVARISVTTDLFAKIDLAVENQAKVTGSLTVTKSSGTILFDPAAGRLVKTENSMELGGDLSVDAGGQSFPVKQTQTQTYGYELLDKLPE